MTNLQPQQLEVSRDPWGKLQLHDRQSGTTQFFVPIRLFPISDPEHWISLYSAAGKEITCFESLTDLEPATRELLEAELATQGFFPIIEKVLHISSLAEPCEWSVVTDRGPTRFVLKSEDDVRRLGPHRAFIVDAHGIRYLIRDSREMDATSRHFVEWYL